MKKNNNRHEKIVGKLKRNTKNIRQKRALNGPIKDHNENINKN